MRASCAFALVILSLAAIGFTYLSVTSDEKQIYVAARDIPPYHQLTQADLRLASRSRREVPKKAVEEGKRNDLLGAYTLSALGQDKPFSTSMVGPHVPDGSLDGRVMVALAASPETALGGRLGRGDRVDVLLSSEAPTDSVRLNDVLVVDVLDTKRGDSVVLGIKSSDEDHLLTGYAGSKVLVIRVKSYVRL
ncbi:hypothetical protein GCM10027569_63800 [Flindersiella endophytica]